MALSLISNGTLSDASNINQVIYILQRQATQQETGKYFLQGQGYTSLANFGNYIPSLSRTSTPSGVTIDTADQSPTAGTNSPGAQNLTANGFLVFFTTGGAVSSARAGGNTTIQFTLLFAFISILTLLSVMGGTVHFI